MSAEDLRSLRTRMEANSKNFTELLKEIEARMAYEQERALFATVAERRAPYLTEELAVQAASLRQALAFFSLGEAPAQGAPRLRVA